MKRSFILFTAACFLFTGLPLLSAQESATEEFTLEEITVTAQKREENQQKVAISMEVITGEQMAEKGMNNIDEVLQNVSNAIINMSSDGMRVSLRGLANDNSTQKGQTVSTPTVAVNIDGAYNSNNNAGQNLFDVERVEVLSGPQSTMYASNSPGGVINVVTASPKTDKFSTNASIEVGNYNLVNTQAAVNVPVIQDKLAMRAALNWSKRDSYIEGSDSTSAEDTKNVRLKALYQANDDMTFSLTGTWSKRGGGGGMGGGVMPFDEEDGYWYDVTETSMTKADKVTDPWTASDVDAQGSGNNSSDITSKGISGEFAWSTGIGSLTIVPSYTKSESSERETVSSTDASTGVTTYAQADSVTENSQKGIEARMASSSDFTLFQWIAGANYYKSHDERGTDFVNPTTFDEYNFNEEETKALFVNITYPVTDRFRATGGYRMSWDTMSSEEAAQDGPGGESDVTTTSEQEYSNPDYKLGVEYDLADNTMLYMDRSTSYRVNSMGQSTDPPERMVAWTLGAKNRFFGNKLQVNASAFYYKYRNRKASLGRKWTDTTEYEMYEKAVELGYDDPNVDYDGDDVYNETEDIQVSEQNSQTVGSFRSYGIDISTSAIITSKDRLSLSFSYLNSKWEDLFFDFEYNMLWDDESYEGVVETYSPAYSATASYEHNFTLWNGGTLTGIIDGQFQSKYVLAWKPSSKPVSEQEPHTLWNASATYAHPNGVWTLNGYVKNIMNYAVKVSYMDMGGNCQLTVGNPRTYGAILTVRF